MTANAVSLGSTAGDDAADLELPAEAFVRLVYGRLNSQHTPVGLEGSVVQTLRRIFRGV